MEDIDPSPTPSPNPRKRPAPDNNDSSHTQPLNLKGTQFVMPTPPQTDHSSNVSISPHIDNNSRPASPAPSSSALSSVEIVDNETMQQSSSAAAILPIGAAGARSLTSERPPAKRRKLTSAEKLHKQQEKDAKAAGKVKQKSQKDEEKRQKAEERDEKKRVRDEEKRKISEEREAKKREKELEDERKAQEKLKKERSQMRLGVFFQKPATPVKQDDSGGPAHGPARRKSISLEPFDAVADEIGRSQSPTKASCSALKLPQTLIASPLDSNRTAVVLDYHRYFLPFQLKTYSTIAADLTPQTTDQDQDAFDSQLHDPSVQEKYDLGLVESYASLERQFANQRQAVRGFPAASVKMLVDQINGTLQQPIDLTSNQKPSNPMNILHDVSQRYLEFSEDVRPAYFGTYSKSLSPRTTHKLRRNPYTRARKDTDYEYDSEAEWEEPEEGEDILDEEDDEADSQGDAQEMDEFLDDEDDAPKHKRKPITDDLAPASTGICWEDPQGKMLPSAEQSSMKSMKGMRMGVLLPGFTGLTIDPFSTAYWDGEAAKENKLAPATRPTIDQANGFLAPPRPPLQPRLSGNGTLEHMLVGAAQGEKGPITSMASTQGSKPGRKPAPKTLSTEDMEEFKEAVVNSPLSKADLLKGLKARFPKITNETIRATLGEQFAQVGASKADKKWVFVTAT